MNEVLAFAQNGIGQMEANPGSQWWAYNAVTGFFSNKKADDPNDRMESLLWGTAAKTMERALDFAVNPGKVVALKNSEVRNSFAYNLEQTASKN